MDKAEVLKITYTDIIGWLGSVLSIVGFILSILNFIVLTRPALRSQRSTLYLLTLDVWDMLFLILDFLVTSLDWLIYSFRPDLQLYIKLFSNPASVIFNPLITVAITGSVYTTIALTIDRCIAVVKPLQWSSICTTFRIKVVLSVIFAWAFLINAPMFAEVKFITFFNPRLNRTLVTQALTDYGKRSFHNDVYLPYIVPLHSLVIPIPIIFVCNAIIIARISCKRKEIASSQSQAARAKDANRLTAQVVFISIFTLVSRVLEVVVYFLTLQSNSIFITKCTIPCIILSCTSTTVIKLNAAVNFACYCFFGRKFRTVFWSTFSCFRRCKSCPCPEICPWRKEREPAVLYDVKGKPDPTKEKSPKRLDAGQPSESGSATATNGSNSGSFGTSQTTVANSSTVYQGSAPA